jgi:hypothetical protein
MILDVRFRYGNIQIRQNDTNNTKFLVLSDSDLNQTIGFNQTTLDFSQAPACGRACKTCTVEAAGPTNCTDCCAANAHPVNGSIEADCACNAKYHNVAPDNFTLECTNGASSLSSGFLIVFGLLSLLFGSNL